MQRLWRCDPCYTCEGSGDCDEQHAIGFTMDTDRLSKNHISAIDLIDGSKPSMQPNTIYFWCGAFYNGPHSSRPGHKVLTTKRILISCIFSENVIWAPMVIPRLANRVWRTFLEHGTVKISHIWYSTIYVRLWSGVYIVESSCWEENQVRKKGRKSSEEEWKG